MTTEADIILLKLKPTETKTFCCPGCSGKTRDAKDRRQKTIISFGRVTKVTRCVYCLKASKALTAH